MAAIEFDNPFGHLVRNGQKLSKPELIRALRYMISAEYEATGLYQQFSEVLPEEYAYIGEVLEDIAKEELQHVGEFMTLLSSVSEEEFEYYDKGMEEAAEIIEGDGYDSEDDSDDTNEEDAVDTL